MSWRDRCAETLEEGRELAALTTWRIGGRARAFLRPRDREEAASTFAELHAAGEAPRLLGGGANLLVADDDQIRPIMHLDRLASIEEDGDLLVVDAGVSFPKLVQDSARAGRSGLEVLAGIPGQMGGICRMNAGGRWGEVRDVVRWVEVADESGAIVRLANDECGFAYRSSRLPGVVLRVAVELGRGDAAALRAQVGDYLKRKSASQPLKLPSAGCCWANPPEIPAGLLVEELGLKGERRGDACISEMHGNFIVNIGQASCAETLDLMELVEREARTRRGIELRREVELWTAD